MEEKKISIITINLNNKDGLEKTINSVINQTYFDKIEYIVIDGDSTDGSKDILEKYNKYFSCSVSEKDSGIYNAMNKGIKAASSEYVLFLKSGDNFINNDVIKDAYDKLTEDIVYGNLLVNGKMIKKYPDNLTHTYLLNDTLPHPATFIKRNLLLEHNYREDFKIISDWVFFYESIIKRNASYRHLDLTISNFMLNGISSNQLNVLTEKRKYLESIFYKQEIGVVIPCYNQASYIKETLDSLKASTYHNFYCVIVNDGSTDNSEEIILREIEGDDRFHYIKQENKGLSNARNMGIKNLNSKYILCLDSDDKIAPTYIEKGVNYLNKNYDVAIFYGKAKLFYDDGTERDWHLPMFDYKLLLKMNHIYCSFIYRRIDYNRTSGYDEAMKAYEDWDFLIRLLYNSGKRVAMINDVMFYYRQRKDGLNSFGEKNSDEIKKYIMDKNKEIYARYHQLAAS